MLTALEQAIVAAAVRWRNHPDSGADAELRSLVDDRERLLQSRRATAEALA